MTLASQGPLPAELIGVTRETKVLWLRTRGWRPSKGAWIDPVGGELHTLGWALRVEGNR